MAALAGRDSLHPLRAPLGSGVDLRDGGRAHGDGGAPDGGPVGALRAHGEGAVSLAAVEVVRPPGGRTRDSAAVGRLLGRALLPAFLLGHVHLLSVSNGALAVRPFTMRVRGHSPRALALCTALSSSRCDHSMEPSIVPLPPL